MKNRVNPSMIRVARDYRGVTQKKLAENLSTVSQGNLSRMERGNLAISKEAIDEISKFLNFPTSFFHLQGVRTPLDELYYRKRVSLPKKKQYSLEALFDIFSMGIDSLYQAVDIPDFSIPLLSPERLTPSDIARKLRALLNIPKGPVKSVIELMERVGVTVVEIEAQTDKFDGMAMISDEGHPIVFLNSSAPNDRKRRTLIHEFGHLIMHIRQPHDTRPSSEKDIEADRFASEFLVPELEIRNSLSRLNMKQLYSLKLYWGVSMKSLIYRAKDLHIISKDRAQNLYIELSRKGYVKNEPGFIEFQKPTILKQVINLYLNNLQYSVEEIAEIVNLTKSEFEKIFLKTDRKVIKLNPQFK